MDEWLDLLEVIDMVQEYLELGLYEKAIDILDKYSEAYNTSWEIHYLYSRIFSELDQPQKAIPHLNKGLELEPNNLDCLIGLFYSYSQIKQLDKGVIYLKKANAKYPDDEQVLNALIWYNTEICNFHKAISLYENTKINLENDQDIHRNAGVAYERLGKTDNAIDCYMKALKTDPQSEELIDFLSEQYVNKGLIKKSIDLYTEYLKKSPDNIKAMSRLTNLLSQDNKTQEAITIAQKTIHNYPNSPIGYVDLAYINLNINNLEECLTNANKAIDVSPLDTEALRVKGLVYEEMGNHKTAEELFQKALSFDSENSEIMRDYYNLLYNLSRFDEMKTLIHKVIKQEAPYCTEDYFFLAEYYNKKSEYTKAFSYLRKAQKSKPGEFELLPAMAITLFNAKHATLAMNLLLRYIKIKKWTNSINKVIEHEKLQKSIKKEGIRYLEYLGKRPSEFRDSTFNYFLKKSIIFASALIVFILYIILSILINWGIFTIFFGLFIISITIFQFIKMQKRIEKARIY